MAIIIFIDTTTKSASIISKFRAGRHTAEKVYCVDEVKNKLVYQSGEKILIWHVSSSKIRIDDVICDVSLENIEKATKMLDNCRFDHKFGVTDNDEQYKQKARKAWKFDDVESWDALKDRFSKGLQKGIKSQGITIKTTKNHILRLFLPLDIDMQALETIKDKQRYLDDMYKDLTLYAPEQCKNGHYQQKLYDLWYFLDPGKYKENASPGALKNFDPIPEGKTDNLKLLAGLGNKKPTESLIYKFFESLDNKKLPPAFFTDFKVNEDSTFHEWYVKLDYELRKLL